MLLKEEMTMEKDTALRSSGMASVPFHVGAALQEALPKYRDGETNLLEIAVEGDTIDLVAATTLAADASPRAALESVEEPRFVLLTRPAAEGPVRCFVYFCPDSAPIKAKMTFSTAKATFLEILAGLELAPQKSIETRDADDFDADVAGLLAPPEDKRQITHAANTRPARPGRRGTARVAAKKSTFEPLLQA